MTRALSGLLMAASIVWAGPACAQSKAPDLKQELDALLRGQQEIRKQLNELMTLLGGAAQKNEIPPAPDVQGVELDLGDNPVRGEDTAKVTIVEFTDYQCPVCARHRRDTYPQIEKELIETGKVRYAVLDLPLEPIHRYAFKAAEASHCAEEQGKFWEMHDRMYEHHRDLANLVPHAEAIGLDVAAFRACLDSDRHASGVRRDLEMAAKAGARGTPNFIIASTHPDDPSKVTGIRAIRGATIFLAFQQAVEKALAATP